MLLYTAPFTSFLASFHSVYRQDPRYFLNSFQCSAAEKCLHLSRNLSPLALMCLVGVGGCRCKSVSKRRLKALG